MIPTRDRPRDLAAAVESVLRQTVVPATLVIVDQSPGSESKDLIGQIYAEAPPRIGEKPRLTYVHDPHISGLAEARNRAMDLLEDGIWLFLDDDVILEPRFVEEILAAYTRRPEATGVSGVVTNYSKPPLEFRLWRSIFMRGPFRDDRQAVYWRVEELRDHEPLRVSRLGGGLMSFRAEAIQQLRFNDHLRGVSEGEDVDFCLSLGPRAQFFMAPRARLVHKHSAIGREQRHFLARLSRGAFYLYGRHWNHGFKNRLCFLWLKAGCALLASASALRRRSLEPWRAFLTGARDARETLAGC